MKKIGVTALFFLFVCIHTNKTIATPIDSLKIAIRGLPDDTAKVLELADLSVKYIKYQIDTSSVLAKDAIKLSKKLNYPFGYAYALKQLGLVYKFMAEYDSSLFYYTQSLEYFDSVGVSYERASLLNRIANIYKRKGQFEKSLENFHAALSISVSINDSILISAIYNNLGILYFDLRQYDKALEYQMLNLSVKKQSKSNKDIPIIMMNIGNIYTEKRNYDRALEYYKQSVDLFEDSGSKLLIARILHNMASTYEHLEKYQIAEDYYLKSIKVKREIGNRESLIYSLHGLGNVFLRTNNFKKGIQYLEDAYALAINIGDIRHELRLSRSLYIEYARQGNYKKGFEYLEKYLEFRDSIYSMERNKQIVELEQKYEAEKREQQIAFLEKEKALQELELTNKAIENKRKSFQRNILIIVSILAIALVVYYFMDNKKRKKLNDLLKKQNKKITDQQLEIAKQNEDLTESNNTKDKLLQIIAHDLRSPLVSIDSVTQLIPMWIENKDYESLDQMSYTIESSIHGVLSLIDNLLSWTLNQQGKFPYKPEKLKLRDCIQEIIRVYQPIAQIKNIDLRFNMTGNIVVHADKNMLLTVLRNLLNNAIKFTREQGLINVGMESNKHFARVWIKDTGIGIPESKKDKMFEIAKGSSKGTKGEPGKGLGLFFCKEFVAMNKGNIFVDSKEGEGTTITFTLPLFDEVEI